MKRILGAALIGASLLSSVVAATPASADTSPRFAGPSSGLSGAATTWTSTDPCPAPPSGTTLATVGVLTFDWPGQRLIAGQETTPDASGGWSVSTPITGRNGRYAVIATCLTDKGDVYAIYQPRTYDITSNGGDPAMRIAGSTRIATAIAASKDVFADGGADTVVLSRSDSYADALAGTPLARQAGGPLLLTPTNALDPNTAAEIDRVLDGQGTVYVLGGTAAIGANVAQALVNAGYKVVRLAGPDRFATATMVADEIGDVKQYVLADGTDFREGLVAGADAGDGAVLLTNGSTMPQVTTDYLAQHPTTTVYAVGAPAAAADPRATAIVGSDPADTSQRAAADLVANAPCVGVASDAGFADALSGGVHAAWFGCPLLLTDPTSLPSTVANYLRAQGTSIEIGFVYGGTAAVADSVVGAVASAIS